EHAVDRILQVPGIREVVVVTPPADERLADALRGRPESVRTTPGGASRAESVRNGLAHVCADAELILVHDAARAFAPASLFQRVLDQLDMPGCEAAIPALAVTDTISVVAQDPAGGELVVQTPDRSTLRAVQTPQGFSAAA